LVGWDFRMLTGICTRIVFSDNHRPP
jgi:hypothetical protein